MKPDTIQHLDEDQLIQAVVDAADLPRSVQEHLAECSQCIAGKNSFDHQMTMLGQKAEQFAPQPQRRIMLPVQKTRNPFANLLDWRNLIAAAAAVTAVFILVWGTNLARNLSEPDSTRLKAEMVEAEILMTEVNTLVDNALPPFYLEISGEKKSDYDEKFYHFLIPTIEDKTLSLRKRRNIQGLHRLLVRFQGTPKAGRKTKPPWRIDFFASEALVSEQGKKGTRLC